MNSTDWITTAAFSVKNGDPVYISTNTGAPYSFGINISVITAGKRLSELLPPGFSASSFTLDGAKPDTAGLIVFYLDLELPHKGTDVLAHIRPLPVGLRIRKDSPEIDGDWRLTSPWPWKPDRKECLRYDVPYVANADKTLLFSVFFTPFADSGMMKAGISESGLSVVCGVLQEAGHGNLLQQPWATLTPEQKRTLALTLPFAQTSEEESLAQLEYLHMLEAAWNSLHWETLVLGWNKEQGRFFIKNGKTRARKANLTSYCLSSDKDEDDKVSIWDWAVETPDER
jgi:hypothetical protein